MACGTLFVGLGSDHGDDRAGWIVADLLRERRPEGLVVRRALSSLDLLDWLDGVERLALCDACRGAGPIGSWHCWTWPCADRFVERASGSHDLGLAGTLQLASRLGRLPSEVRLWGIEIGNAAPGRAMSPEVLRAASEVANALAAVVPSRDENPRPDLQSKFYA